jgi:hypothetical protein
MLYQLSYASIPERSERLERETRIELATNSLEGCDSTIELLPPGWPTRAPAFATIVTDASAHAMANRFH